MVEGISFCPAEWPGNGHIGLGGDKMGIMAAMGKEEKDVWGLF